MKRTDKYPETSTFVFHNENPKGRITTDCVVRAIAKATEESYIDTLAGLIDMQVCTGYSFNDSKCYVKYLESIGFKKMPQPRKADGTKYTGKEFCDYIDTDYEGGIVAHCGGNHLTCIYMRYGVNKVHDTWDCTEGCIGNYWVREHQEDSDKLWIERF